MNTPLGFPSGTGYRGRGDNHRQRSILARRLTRLLKANRWTFDVGTIGSARPRLEFPTKRQDQLGIKSLDAKSGQKETPIFRSGFRGGGKEVLAKMDDYFSFVLLNSFCLHSEVIVIKWT